MDKPGEFKVEDLKVLDSVIYLDSTDLAMSKILLIEGNDLHLLMEKLSR